MREVLTPQRCSPEGTRASVEPPGFHPAIGDQGLLEFPRAVPREHAQGVLVGRSGELARLDALAVSALAGNGGRLVLVGDPGMGKSALLRALERQARRRGVRSVHARAAEGPNSAGSPLLEGLSPLEGSSTGRPSGADPAESAEEMAHDILRYLASTGPVLLLIDDAHKADAASLRALRTAIELLGPSPLAIAIATRPHTPAATLFPPWPHLVVKPLDREAALALLRAALGPQEVSPILDQIAAALHDHPLMLEAAAHLLTSDQIAGRAPLPNPLPVPATLTAAWAEMLDPLGRPAQDTLLDLAVAGDRLDLLTTMADPRDALDQGLDDAIRAGMVVVDPGGQPVLRTPTLRDVVLNRTPAAELRRAHRRAAVAAQRLDLAPGVVVDHLARSVITADDGIACELAVQAARAQEAEHYAVAARAWDVAAHLTTVPSDRRSFALSAIQVSYDIGLPVARSLLDIVSLGSLEPRTGAQLAGIRAEQRSDLDPASALPAILGQVMLAGQGAPEQMPTLLLDAVSIAWQMGDAQAALRAAQQYAALEQSATDPHRPDPPWTALGVMAAALFQVGDVARAMPLRAEAIAAAATTDPRATDLPTLLCIVGLDEILLDVSPGASDRLLVAAERAGEDSGLLPWLYCIQGWRAKARGDWRTARSMLDTGRPRAADAGLVQRWMGLTALSVELAALVGDDDILSRDSVLLREVAFRCGNQLRLAGLDRALGLRALADGRLGDAIAGLSAAADVGLLGRGLRDAVLPARVDLIEALVRSGDLASATERHAQLHGLLAAIGDPLATALDERTAALVTGGAEAETHFREALDAHAGAEEPFEEARTLLLLGEHLRRERRPAEARTALQRAVHTFEGLGASPWLARALQELRAAGGSAGTAAGATPLTPQEDAVARAVATGMSNREVAEALFLSLRTVEYHLGNVYRKLEVHGRGALAHALDATPAPASPPPA